MLRMKKYWRSRIWRASSKEQTPPKHTDGSDIFGAVYSRRKNLIPLIVVLQVFFAFAAHAGEIKIVDQDGLTRAFKKLKSGSTAEVHISIAKVADSEVQVHLNQLDGTASERSPNPQENGIFVFTAVEEGIWKIKVSNPSALIQKVRIR